MKALADAAIRAHTFSMAGAYQTYAAHAFAADSSQDQSVNPPGEVQGLAWH